MRDETGNVACLTLNGLMFVIKLVINRLEATTISKPSSILADDVLRTSIEEHIRDKSDDWLLDFELMRHYANHTCRAPLTGTKSQYLWRDIIPLEAVRRRFLMHGILALAAVQRAHCETSKAAGFLEEFDKHQAEAVASYRQILSNVTHDVANALFAHSSILSVTSLASATLRANALPGPQYISVGGICEILYLTKGSREINRASGDAIRRGPLSAMLLGHNLPADTCVALSRELQDVLRSLDAIVMEFL